MISIPFNQFVESYKKLDKSLFYKFFSNFDLYPETDKEYAEIFEFSDDQSPLFLLENLKTSNNSSESFEKHCFDNLLTEISENKWQNVLFELLFELKSGLNPDLSNLSSLFIRLNELNTKALPNYFCALVLFNILNNQREDFNVFLNS